MRKGPARVLRSIATLTTLVGACVVIALSLHTWDGAESLIPRLNSSSKALGSLSPEDRPSIPDLRYARSAEAPAAGEQPATRAAGERSAAYSTLMRADRSIYNDYEDHRLLVLAEQNDPDAQLALAVRLFETLPEQALGWARRAAGAGNPVAATLVAEAMAGEGDVAGGFAAMIEFEEAHGTDALLTRYMRSYLQIHAKSPAQLREQARLKLAMKRFQARTPAKADSGG